MDAVVFMDAVKRPQGPAAPPPPPSQQRKGLSANASLIAGVATLVLAIGVGVLIGRSGEQGATTANTAPQVIKVEGGGGAAGTEEATASGGKESSGGGKTKKAAKSEAEAGSSGTSKAAEEVLKPEAGVKLPPPKAQVGEECEKGTAGCGDSGKFDGSFFGE